MSKLKENIELLKDLDNETRLELMLDYAQKLPPLPKKYRSQAEIELHRVPECQTPVSLWLEIEKGSIHIYADVPRESPTVRGFLSFLIDSLSEASLEELKDLPDDILYETGLSSTLGMMRMQGLSGIYQRIKNEIAQTAVNNSI